MKPIVGVAGGSNGEEVEEEGQEVIRLRRIAHAAKFHPVRNLNVIGGYHGEEVEEEGQEVIRLRRMFWRSGVSPPYFSQPNVREITMAKKAKKKGKKM